MSDRVSLVSTLQPEGPDASLYLGTYCRGMLSMKGVGMLSAKDAQMSGAGSYYERVGDPSKMILWDGSLWVVANKRNPGRRIGVVCVDAAAGSGFLLAPPPTSAGWTRALQPPSPPTLLSATKQHGNLPQPPASPLRVDASTAVPHALPPPVLRIETPAPAARAVAPAAAPAAALAAAALAAAEPAAAAPAAAVPAAAEAMGERTPAAEREARREAEADGASAAPPAALQALDLEYASLVRRRSDAARARLEAAVGEARSETDQALERRARELLRPSFDEWASGRIETAELERRKAAAPLQAAAELGVALVEEAGGRQQRCHALDAAVGAYTAAVHKREAAWAAYAEAAAGEATAEAAVHGAVDALQHGAGA